MSNSQDNVPQVSSSLTWKDKFAHIRARMGVFRYSFLLPPGLYKVGEPDKNSPVFVTANFRLSFDKLRSSLKDINGYILVLDTKGINVWCAAGKGTFGTDELVRMIEESKLEKIVSHKELILPQLGATGIAAHEVRKRSGFKILYGPVRADDISAFMKNRNATEKMREVFFPLRERMALVSVEVVHMFFPVLLIGLIAYLTHGLIISIGIMTSFIAGIILFPFFLPWLPSKNFSTKGFFLGGILSIPFAFFILTDMNPQEEWWIPVLKALSLVLIIVAVTGFISLNFTGSSTFTSKSGVKMEFKLYIPAMFWMGGLGILLFTSIRLVEFFVR